MTYSSSLSDQTGPLILDTSVLINLHACRRGAEILSAIPNPIVISNIVAGELDHETSRRNGEKAFLCTLETAGKVSLVDLSDQEFKFFFELTSTSPSLDDGEAATIAIARSRGILPVIDEKRGRRRVEQLMRTEAYWSLDILTHPDAIDFLGADVSREVLFLALRDGRMRIPPESTQHVVNSIGIDQARDCTCLPGYKGLFDVLSASEQQMKLGL